jgi:predicted esterase
VPQKIVLVLLALAALPAAPAVAQDDPLPAAVADLFAARGGEATEAAVAKVLALSPEPAKVLDLLRRGPAREAPAERGWLSRKTAYPDGAQRPWHLLVPENYDPAIPSPVLVHMHGGVSRPEMIPEEQMAEYREFWAAGAAGRGVFLVFPFGQRGAEWWTENGAEGLERILLDLRRDYNVDEDAAFATGFSDGGSGCFYLAMTRPTTWAGFIPLNGHPAVPARAGERQLHLVNTGMRPFFMVNTQDDQLYPTRTVLPFLEAMLRAGAAVRFASYPGIGHSPDYYAAERDRIYEWMDANSRDPLPRRIDYETAYPDNGRCAWVTILSLGDTPGAPEFADLNPLAPEDRVRLGVTVDQDFPGPGVKVAEVTKDSLAEAMGMKAGDVIVGVDEAEVDGMPALSAVLGTRVRGRPIEVRVKREAGAAALAGTIPPFVPEPTFPRGKPSGRIEATVKGQRIDVRLRGVAKYALDLGAPLVDLAQEIVVTTNGKESFRGVVPADLGHLLRSYARDRDRSMLPLARLVIEVTPE